jgi:hypothetical protein
MSSSRRLIGLGVAGALAFTACDGSPEPDYGEVSIELAIPAKVPERAADIADRSPFDTLDFWTLYGGLLSKADSDKQINLSGGQCAALAIAQYSLGNYGDPAYDVFEVEYGDGSTSIEMEELTSPVVLRGLSLTILEVLDVDGDGIVELYSPEHKDAVIAAKSAASIINYAAVLADDFNNLSLVEALAINGTKKDFTTEMLDRARNATETALDTGCSYLQ